MVSLSCGITYAPENENVNIPDVSQQQNDTLPHFSHIPPAKIWGRRHWPNSLEAQGFPDNKIMELSNILIWVVPYLEEEEKKKLCCTTQDMVPSGFIAHGLLIDDVDGVLEFRVWIEPWLMIPCHHTCTYILYGNTSIRRSVSQCPVRRHHGFYTKN
jgi:hypothetical protein